MDVVFHQTSLDDLKGIFKAVVLDAMRENESKQFERRNIRKEKEFEFLTRKETAKKLNISLVTLHNWTKDGKIQGMRIGTRVLYRVTDIDSALEAITTTPVAARRQKSIRR
jgi:excisionase family DNA binding protein